jgi:hypothetical protein
MLQQSDLLGMVQQSLAQRRRKQSRRAHDDGLAQPRLQQFDALRNR